MAFGSRDPREVERLDRAVELMNGTDKPLSQISSEVGLGSTGEVLADKLLSSGRVTSEELSARRKSINQRNSQ